MINLQIAEGMRVIELGGGDNPHPGCTCHVDIRPGARTDFTCDFNEPLPISSDEWDGLYSCFVLEHISWRKVRQFLRECCRILKPGAKAVFVTPNTEAQLEHIRKNPDGWDGRGIFDSASCILYGDQDYPENSHKCYLSPVGITRLLQAAGFDSITITPFGTAEVYTDMLIEAVKPIGTLPPDAPTPEVASPVKDKDIIIESKDTVTASSPYHPEKVFNFTYFDNYQGRGFIWDYPQNELITYKVLERKPESVLELGCQRGYILKRLEDRGIQVMGLEVSPHCYLTRVTNSVFSFDITHPWYLKDECYDLCLSLNVLEYIPESLLPDVVEEMQRVCKRGLHAIHFGPEAGSDSALCTLKPKEWWQKILPQGHEVVSREELEQGSFSEEYLQGDGRLKLALGTFMTMSHYGWLNIDEHDLSNFANANGYKFKQWDIRNGLPYATGVVDCIHTSHMLEHLTQVEGLRLLRECRRVMRPDGCLRVIVPDVGLLLDRYVSGVFDDLDEVNMGCKEARTPLGKFWALALESHKFAYDGKTLLDTLEQAGFEGKEVGFRKVGFDRPTCKQMQKECIDVLACLSLYVDAIPLIG